MVSAERGKTRGWKILAVAAVNAVMLIAAGLLMLLFAKYTGLSSQQAAERWEAEDNRYTQMSAFFADDAAIVMNNIYTYRSNINKQLEKNSIVSQNENARLWIDAFSAQKEITVYSERSGDSPNVTVTAICTGGDFFQFHPMKLVSGSYFDDASLLQDSIILDYQTAWRLFGSSDVEGMTVMINGYRFYVSGVVKQDESKVVDYVCGNNLYVYLSYDLMSRLLGEEPLLITSYEACLPNPVKGVAENMFKEAVTASTNCMQQVNNSSRYSLVTLMKISVKNGERSVVMSPVVYPFWENIARVYEDKAARVELIILLLLIFPFLTAIYLLLYLIRNLSRFISAAKANVTDKVNAANYKRYHEARKDGI